MSKAALSSAEVEIQAEAALRSLFEELPFAEMERIDIPEKVADRELDILARIKAFGHAHLLICEVKSSGQPRFVRMGILQLKHALAKLDEKATPIIIAPFLSAESQALCRDQGVGFLDLEGNCRLVFDGVFIERRVPARPSVERRALKSIFTPKSAQVLRLMLRDPARLWRVADLAEAARVSLGHVSNVRTALIDREWAGIGDKGLVLARPGALLDAWRHAYEPPPGMTKTYYTVLHGKAFDEALSGILGTSCEPGRAILASFSAARWLAPYARSGSQFLYADARGLERLQQILSLSPASKGGNVVVTVLKDEGLLIDAFEAAPGIFCTSPVQTYLDLALAGERGREAAEHLRRERLSWPR